ncbi:hypothetical protein K2173_019510 [Erythroxylum novogranatense]|uniref:F-box domain-containing protein n=1 Tax=Erythroxylum novogranatense TaxID=1862640 RepID=A0AAV8UBG9_9ROSI|nr:hypothetical protein K2173_019510 [Erythroxylum novogranatense]
MSKTKRRSKTKGKNLMKNEDTDKDHHPLPLPHIPDEIIYSILLRVSPEALQKKMRYICYSWFNLISSSRFRKLQNEIHEEKQELIIQCSSGNPVCRTYLLVMEEEGVDFQLTHFRLNQKGRIRASCNGFIVVNDPKNVKLLHVMNLVTKKSVTLPPCGSGCRHSSCGIALTFNSSTQEYKVVHIYVDGYGIEIYTLGCSESAWNRIPGPFHGREHERIITQE